MYKKFIVIALTVLLMSTDIFSQDCTGIAGPITEREVNVRVKQFTLKAKFMSRKNISTTPLLLDATGMKSMLQDFLDMDTNNKNKYDGVRIYFIISEKEIGDSSKLSLLFVPTFATSEPEECNARNRSQDDDLNAYYFSNTVLKKIDLTNSTAESFSVLKRRISYGDIAAKTPRGIGRDFEESQSMWYSKEVFFKEGMLKDMLTFLKKCTSVTGIEVYFASFPEVIAPSDCEKFQNKTLPIFKLVLPGLTGTYFTLASSEIMKKNKKLKKPLNLSSTYSDTGLPCPPNKCN